MSDLRSRQKRKREEAIIKAAMLLISEKGYRNTSIEEIAEKAEVGPATVYNYFGTKSEIFISIFNRKIEVLLRKGAAVLDSPPAGAEEAVYKLAETYFHSFSDNFDRQLLREVFVTVLIEQLSIRKKVISLEYELMAQFGKLMEIIKQRGQINAGTDTADVATIVYTLTMSDLLIFLVDDDMMADYFLNMVKRHIHLLFRGFAP